MAPTTKYKPEFCERVIAWMRQGKSFESFGGEILVSKDTLYNWRKKRRAFSDAVGIGESLSRKWWETLGQNALLELPIGTFDGQKKTIKNFNTQLFALNVRNRFPHEWSERQNVALVDKDNQPQSFTDWVETMAKKKVKSEK